MFISYKLTCMQSDNVQAVLMVVRTRCVRFLTRPVVLLQTGDHNTNLDDIVSFIQTPLRSTCAWCAQLLRCEPMDSLQCCCKFEAPPIQPPTTPCWRRRRASNNMHQHHAPRICFSCTASTHHSSQLLFCFFPEVPRDKHRFEFMEEA